MSIRSCLEHNSVMTFLVYTVSLLFISKGFLIFHGTLLFVAMVHNFIVAEIFYWIDFRSTVMINIPNMEDALRPDLLSYENRYSIIRMQNNMWLKHSKNGFTDSTLYILCPRVCWIVENSKLIKNGRQFSFCWWSAVLLEFCLGVCYTTIIRY